MKTLIYTFLLLCTMGVKAQDKEISLELSAQVGNSRDGGLFYPASVRRFYQDNGFQPAWIKPQTGLGSTWQAMLLIDCVLQFGLSHADYHPYELSYDTLHTMLEEPAKYGAKTRARLDIVFTDAVITLMNHLHYGKLNPDYAADRVDSDLSLSFRAEKKLQAVLLEKDLIAAVVEVQPKNKAYADLQEYLRLAKGQYAGDCYDVPEGDIRLAAINLERLRWANLEEIPYVQVNIPSYTLTLHEPDSVYGFKVIVGKPERPTPLLKSAIGYFTTAPDWKVPQKIFVRELLPKALAQTNWFEQNKYTIYDKAGMSVELNSVVLKAIARNPSGYSLRQSSGCDNALGAVVFRFPNDFDVYLHDSPDQKLFNRQIRSLSHGCIRVQKATELAALLLRYDGSAGWIPLLQTNVSRYLKSDFMLKRPVPIKVTYLTCGVRDGVLEKYKDLYHFDQVLTDKLYNTQPPLASN